MELWIGIGIFAGFSVVAGLLLSLVHLFCHSKKDEKIEAVREVLPHLNCGLCGFSSCEDYATNIVKQQADMHLCRPGGKATVEKIKTVIARFD